jgi:hypothetical protein
MLVVLCLAVWQAQAQAPTFTSVKAAGGTRPSAGNAIAVDVAGNSYVAGSFGFSTFGGTLDLTTTNLVSAGDSDGFLAKFSNQGDCLWARQIAGIQKDDAYDVIVRSDGSILITGEFTGTNRIGNTTLVSGGGIDIFLAAFSSSGDLLWARAFGGTLDDFAIGLAPAANGSALFTGSFAGNINLGAGISFSSSDDDALLMKLDSAGNVQWARRGQGAGFQLGSDVKVDAQGDIYWAGEFETNIVIGATTLTSTGPNIFIAKYNSAGGQISVRKVGDGEWAELPRLALGPNGRVLCSAAYYGDYTISGQALPFGADDVLLASFDSSDSLQWVTSFGGSEVEVCTKILPDSSGAAHLIGHFRGNMIVGNTNLLTTGNTDIFVLRCSADGQLKGAVKAGGLGSDLAFGASATASGDIRITGNFAGTAQFGSASVTSPDGLPKMYFASLLPAPTLRITALPNAVLVSWPSQYAVFSLQRSTTLDASSWSPVSTSPTVVNGEFVVTNQLSGAPTFFRLRK